MKALFAVWLAMLGVETADAGSTGLPAFDPHAHALESVPVLQTSSCPAYARGLAAVLAVSATEHVTFFEADDDVVRKQLGASSRWLNPLLVMVRHGRIVDAVCGAGQDATYNRQLVTNLLRSHGLLNGPVELLRPRHMVDVDMLRDNLWMLRSWPFVDFSGLDLRGLDFGGVCAGGSRFVGSDLRGTRWWDAVLSGADLCGARIDAGALDGALLYDARCPDGTRAHGVPGTCVGHLAPADVKDCETAGT